MNYRTFENKTVNLNEVDHQHLSNIYWFNAVVNNKKCPDFIMDQINSRFNGSILSYIPKSTFKQEIDILDRDGLLEWKDVDGNRVADIVFMGQKIGEACYAEDHRNILISKIMNNE
jgi:hypothetical protein